MANRIKGSMTEGPILGNIIRYTIPIMLTSVLQLLFNAADLVVVGRFCGSLYVGAVGATGSLTTLIVNLFMGLSVGAGVATAHAIGARDTKKTFETVHTAIPIALVCGVFLTIVGFFVSEPLLRLIGTPEKALQYSALYLKIYFLGTIFNLMYNFAASVLRAAGDTKSPLIYLTIGGIVNVILNVIFVTVFHMKVEGVAIATITSQAIAAVLTVIALMRREDAVKFFFSKMHFYKASVGAILKIGIPAGIQNSLFAISNTIIQSAVNSFGDVFLAGSAAASNVEGFQYVMMNSFSQAALNFTGQNVGAKKYDRVKKILVSCFLCVIVVGVVTGVLENLFADELLSIYITDSPQAVEYGRIKMLCIGIPYFLCGMMEVTMGVLRGMGSSTPPTIISIIGVCGVRMGWIYTIFAMEKFHTPEVLFLSYTVSWILTTLAQYILYKRLIKKKIKEQEA